MKKSTKRSPVRKGCACVNPVPPTVEQQLQWANETLRHAEGRASAYRDAIELFTRRSVPMNAPGLGVA